MRSEWLWGVLLVACLAGCGAGESPAPVVEAPTKAAAGDFMRAVAERRARRDEAAPTVGGPRLQAALPGGVLPEFDHVLGSDLASRHGHATRIVTLRARGIDARGALEALARGFTAAGFESGTVSSGNGALLQEFWTPGTARGLAAVSAGGTRIGVMASDYGPDSASVKEGFPALVVVTVNSP